MQLMLLVMRSPRVKAGPFGISACQGSSDMKDTESTVGVSHASLQDGIILEQGIIGGARNSEDHDQKQFELIITQYRVVTVYGPNAIW